jgi:hypothetical protein
MGFHLIQGMITLKVPLPKNVLRCNTTKTHLLTALNIGDWECWVAAVASNSTQKMFFNLLATWIDKTPTDLPLTDLYSAITGE